MQQLDTPFASTPLVVASPPNAQTTSSPAATDTPALPALQTISTAAQVPEVDTPAHHASVDPVEGPAAARGESAPVHHEAPVLQQAATGPQLAALAPQAQPKSAKPDYGWLADLMTRWIEDLDKRYPAVLRTEGVQGKVTLTAVLHENGLLTDVQVTKSSGNAMLDQVALEDVRKGPPIKLSRSLDKPRMPVKFSIVYDLKTVR